MVRAAWDGWYIRYVFTHLARRVVAYQTGALDPNNWFEVRINLNTNEVFISRARIGGRPKYLVRAKDELDVYLQLTAAMRDEPIETDNFLYVIY